MSINKDEACFKPEATSKGEVIGKLSEENKRATLVTRVVDSKDGSMLGGLDGV